MQRIILFLSVLLIVCALAGIFIFMPKPKPQDNAGINKQEIAKKSFEYLVASEDIYTASTITNESVKVESAEYSGELPEQFSKLLSKDEFSSGHSFAANKHIFKGQKIGKDDIIDINSDEYAKLKIAPKAGFISFAFGLDERGLSVLENTKPANYVDVFFRYETKNPKKDDGIAPKRRKDSDYRNYDTANITTLIPLFENKKVLFKQRIKPDEKTPKEIKEVGQIFLELSQDDAKNVYAIENLGNFFIFPRQDKDKKVISTEKVLQKEFIKELRGGIDAQ